MPRVTFGQSTTRASAKEFPWKRSRSGFAVFFFFSQLIFGLILRVILLAEFAAHEAFSTYVQTLLIGFRQDFLVALIITLPLLAWFSLISDESFGKLRHRIILMAGSFLFWGVQFFLLFTEYFFFEEFHSRFNTVAVDYLLYPTEVFGNIRDSYPLTNVIIICVVASLAWMIAVFRYCRQMWFQPTSRARRLSHLGVAVLVCVLLLATGRRAGTRFSDNRTLNEIAGNGSISFLTAFWTRNLDYGAFYLTTNYDEAYQRMRRMLTVPNAKFTEAGRSIRRKIAGDLSKPKLNVVILLEESLGSEFWGCLGATNAQTPEMDKLATTEGILFTNIYATGNRTVRGFEGALSSFPPLPGDSIVRRDRSDNVETIARVLKRDGYNTLFIYGGRGIFDSMRSFTLRNGYDRFIEQKDFDNPTFTTIWGVCDEDIFARAIEEFRKLNDTGKPFFGTVLSVSNHKPYTYPKGRIPEDPEVPKRTRSKAVKYSDWCLGKFFRDARKEAFWTNTVFVVVADHGARVYGSQSIPIRSYEVPFVVLGPAVVTEPRRVGGLGSLLDVAPTVLGLVGRPYESMFFGRDLLKDPGPGRAPLNHNRVIGMYDDERMVVLGLQKTVEFYEGNHKRGELRQLEQPKPGFLELEKNTMALFQVADDLYMNYRFSLDGAPPPRAFPPTNAPPAEPATTTESTPTQLKMVGPKPESSN